MNLWTKLSIEYASQRSYLDDLFQVYPTIPEGIRDIDSALWFRVERSFDHRDNFGLVESLLDMELFPIKDSYVAYLRRDRTAIQRNPRTVDRIAGRLYEMGKDQIYKRCSEPKETNRQIGPMFKNWVMKKSLGIAPVSQSEFISTNQNAILDASDQEGMDFARTHLNYSRDKGLDFVARFNNKYVIGEAKFLTDIGGHQNAQFSDALSLLNHTEVNAITLSVLDGVLYIPGKSKMYKYIADQNRNQNILSALVLREFLYQL